MAAVSLASLCRCGGGTGPRAAAAARRGTAGTAGAALFRRPAAPPAPPAKPPAVAPLAPAAVGHRALAAGGGPRPSAPAWWPPPRRAPAVAAAATKAASAGFRRGLDAGPRLRCFAASAGSGRGKDAHDHQYPAVFPDSWVEPEALWDYAQAHTEESLDERFATDFGTRNEVWRQKMVAENLNFFSNLASGQSPKYLWIGCCDSRVAAENMVGASPGEIFVHRNIANMVISTDTNLRAVLHYAVEMLGVEHVIVCGHYDCGGVKAAVMKHDHTPPLEAWLSNIRDVYRLHQEELDAIVNDEEKHKRLVELNVIEQCLNLFKTSDVQRRRADTGSRLDLYPCALPRIHGMVYAPADGILRRLEIDFQHYLRKYKNIYQLHDASDFLSSFEVP